MSLLGVPFDVIPSLFEEPTNINAPVDLAGFVKDLALGKALEVWERTHLPIILGADTIVAISDHEMGIPIGKPRDRDDAARMLRLLSGRWHSVFTGLALLRADQSNSGYTAYSSAVETRVLFRALSESMISDYMDTGEPFDKAGAYGAQGFAAPFIEKFDGDFYNVVGLPVCEVGKLCERAGIEWWNHREHMTF